MIILNIDYIEGQCSLTGWLPPLRLVPDFYEIHVLVWPWGGGHLQGDLSQVEPLMPGQLSVRFMSEASG